MKTTKLLLAGLMYGLNILSPCFIAFNSLAQGANNGDRADVYGFVVGNKGYIGGGYAYCEGNQDWVNDLWEFNSANNSWSKKNDFSGGKRYAAATFAIGTKAYLATGNNGGAMQDDLWEWNQVNDTWTQKADIPEDTIIPYIITQERDRGLGFAIGSKGYVGLGWSGNVKKDFWEYDPSTDIWKKIAEFPGAAREGAVAFVINNIAYVGTGKDDNDTYYKDFYKYNPSSEQWTKIKDFQGNARGYAVAFAVNGKGYVGTGKDASTSYNDLWEYNPSNDSWTKKGNTPGNFGSGLRAYAVGFAINDKGYIGTGTMGTGSYAFATNDFWEYEPVSDTWTEKTSISCGTVSINAQQQASSNQFQVYPNPSDGNFELEILNSKSGINNAVIKIYDVLGREIYKSEITNQSFKIQNLKSKIDKGVYFLQLTTDEGVWNERIIVQ